MFRSLAKFFGLGNALEEEEHSVDSFRRPPVNYGSFMESCNFGQVSPISTRSKEKGDENMAEMLRDMHGTVKRLEKIAINGDSSQISHNPHSLRLVSPKVDQEINFVELLQQLPETLTVRGLILTIKNGNSTEQNEAMEEFLAIIFNQGQFFDVKNCGGLVKALSIAISPIYDNFRLPNNLADEAITSSVHSPLFILFRRFLEENKGSVRRERALALLVEMNPYILKMGFLLIYYIVLKASVKDREPMADFEDFCEAVLQRFHNDELNQDSYRTFISESLERCGQFDRDLLAHIVPFVYLECPKVTIDVCSICHTVVRFLDGGGVKNLYCLILQKKLIMFTEKGCGDVLRESLNWKPIEQMYFWKLFNAHDLKDEHWPIVLLAEIADFRQHPEATLQLLECLRASSPREKHVSELLKREANACDRTLLTLFLHWIQFEVSNTSSLGDIIAKLLLKAVSSSKRRATINSPTVKRELLVEQILGHLKVVRDFIDETEKSANKRTVNTAGLVQMLHRVHILVKNVQFSTSSILDRLAEVFGVTMDEVVVDNNKPTGISTKRFRGRPSVLCDEEVAVLSVKPKKIRKSSSVPVKPSSVRI